MDSQDVMTLEQSRAFLRGYLSEDQASDSDLEALAERLGRRECALGMAGRYFELGLCPSVAEYEEKLDDVWNLPSMASWRGKLSGPTIQELNCMAAFGLNWQHIEEETVRHVFLLAGYCAPHHPIPCRALEPATKLQAEVLDAAIDALVGLGLLVMDDPKAGPVIHPSLAEYARAQEGADALLPHLVQRLDSLAYDLRKEAYTNLEPMVPHIRLVASTAADVGLEGIASLYGHLGVYLIRTDDWNGAREAYERALKLEGKARQPDLRQMITYAQFLVLAMRFLGDVEGARAASEQKVALTAELHGPDHISVGQNLAAMGVTLEGMDDLEGARAAFERALPIYERFLESNDLSTLSQPYVSELVYVLATVRRGVGDLEGAKAAYQWALKLDTQLYGADHRKVAVDAGELGRVLQAQGDLNGARAAFAQAAGVSVQANGLAHPTTARYYSYCAGVSKELGKLTQARKLYQNALKIYAASQVPPGHRDIEATRKNLADVEQALRDRGELPEEG